MGLVIQASENLEKRVLVEAAHIYMDEVPSTIHATGASIAGIINRVFSAFGNTTENWLFVDDYNATQSTLDLASYSNMLAQQGYVVNSTVLESDMVPHAQTYIQTQPTFKTNTGISSANQVHLYDTSTATYACALLDACLYTKKQEQADVIITVIDSKMKSQQAKALKLLKLAKRNTDNIIIVYHNQHGVTSVSVPQKAREGLLKPYVNAVELATFLHNTTYPLEELSYAA